jgi:hypothetical protein
MCAAGPLVLPAGGLWAEGGNGAGSGGYRRRLADNILHQPSEIAPVG